MAKLYVGTSSGKKEISIASEESVSTLTSNFNSFKSSTNSSISNINTKITSLQSSSNKSLKSINIGTLNSYTGVLDITNNNLIGLDYIIIEAYFRYTNSSVKQNSQIVVPNGCSKTITYNAGAESNNSYVECSYNNTTGAVYAAHTKNTASYECDIIVHYFA